MLPLSFFILRVKNAELLEVLTFSCLWVCNIEGKKRGKPIPATRM
jgi:hypothetical protein